MDASPTIAAALVEPVAARLEACGGDAGGVLARHGIDRLDPERPEARIDSRVLLDLLDEGIRVSGDAAFGVRAGLATRPGQWGLLDWVIRASRSGRDAIPRIEQNFELIGDVPAPDCEVRDGKALVIHRAANDRAPDAVVDYVLASWLATSRMVAADDDALSEVWLQRPAPPHAPDLCEAFACEVRFAQDVNALAFDATGLDRAFAPTDPAVAHAIDERAATVADGLRNARQTTVAAERAIHARLASGGGTLEEIARHLKQSARTLRRRLRDEGTTFSQLRQRVLEREACRRLESPGASIQEVSHALGFAEPATFHRAFKRWTGITPAAHLERSRREADSR